MALDRVLSQEEIDNVFRNLRETAVDEDPSKRAQPYDFRRPDRIAKDQLRSIHLLHESFARSLSSSLSAYLRNYALVNLVSVEQLSFMEFSQCLPSPTCLITLSMRPYDGNAVLEINPKHDLVLALAKLDDDTAFKEDAAHLLFDEARLLDGDRPTDAKLFSDRLARVLMRSLGGNKD